MEDVTPRLLEAIQREFQRQFVQNKTIQNLYAKIRGGTATYKEANEFAVETGKLLSSSFQKNLSEEVLPDGKMYYNIANRILSATLGNNHKLITDVTSQVQNSLNKTAGVGIKAIVPEINESRITGLVNKVSTADRFSEVAWLLGEPIINFSQSIVDDAIKANAAFQYNAGMTPRIERTSTGTCCDWCNEIVGIYEYPDVPRDVFRRHSYCRCKVDYVVGKYRENIHNNNTGKRRYVQDEYGNYVISKDARIERANKMVATEKARKDAARHKRIETWEKKKTDDLSDVSFKRKDVVKGEKVYTAKEIKTMAKATNEIADKHVKKGSKWTGKIKISKDGRNGKLWDCRILVSKKTAPFILLHEQFHARSISFYDRKTYKKYHIIEEAVVHLMTQEVSKIEHIPIIDSVYDGIANNLRELNRIMKVSANDYEFAKLLLEMPVVNRLEWLEDKAYNHMLKGSDITECIKVNELIEMLR